MNDKLEITIDAKAVYDTLTRVERNQEEMIKHQKETNGKVKKNCADIQDIKDFKNRAMTLWGVVVVIATMLGNVAINQLFN